ncbi:MAG: hypothetical protein WKG07_00985 [Hymenobacter sp.]
MPDFLFLVNALGLLLGGCGARHHAGYSLALHQTAWWIRALTFRACKSWLGLPSGAALLLLPASALGAGARAGWWLLAAGRGGAVPGPRAFWPYTPLAPQAGGRQPAAPPTTSTTTSACW